MAKKVISLTEEEFMSLINEAIEKASHRVPQEITLQISNISDCHDNKVLQIKNILERQSHKTTSNESYKQNMNKDGDVDENIELKKFKGFTFNFFCENGIGIVSHILFTFEKVTHLASNKTILTGNVAFNNQTVVDDRIIINLDNCTASYKEPGGRHQYALEIDSRMKSQWNELLALLQKFID